MAEGGKRVERSRGPRLDVPAAKRRRITPSYDPEAFGRIAESIARFMGTARFLAYLTIMVAAWLAWNTFSPEDLQFDPKALNYTLLTLLLSLQASYAAPLILLAQNRQTDRDRVSLDEDRAQNARLMAEVEYLSRELAALRQSVGEVATRDFLREQLREQSEEILAKAAVAGQEGGAKAYDEAKRAEREERKRRQERKKRAKAQREAEDRDGHAKDGPGLHEPFTGESDD